MSSSPLVQGLQPCVEPRPAYAFKLPRRTGGWLPSVPDPDPVRESKNGDRSSNFPAKGSNKGEKSGGGWSSISESIHTPSQTPAPAWSLSPSASSLPRLNQRSLDLCTEILGSETGKGYIIGDDKNEELTNLLSPPPRPLPEERKGGMEAKPGTRRREVSSRGGLPPPLPSITGGKFVRVVRCMEGGRLVLKATTEPSSLFFQAQRTTYRCEDGSGRSHLCIRYVNEFSPSSHFLKRYRPISPHQGEEEVEGSEVAEVEERGGEVEGGGEEAEEEEEIGAYLGIVGKEMERSHGEEVQVQGVEKFWRRPSRCKEGGGGGAAAGGCGGGSDGNAAGTVLLNWVATS